MQSPNRNKVILIAIIILPVFISLAVFFMANRSSNSNSEEYLDPGSGETISTPKDKAPELFGVKNLGPLYLGFSKLLDAGLTNDQLKLVKVIFGRFAVADGRKLTELSITTKTIDTEVGEEAIKITFELTADRKNKYQCTINYTGLDDAWVVVVDKDDKLIFDSNIQ